MYRSQPFAWCDCLQKVVETGSPFPSSGSADCLVFERARHLPTVAPCDSAQVPELVLDRLTRGRDAGVEGGSQLLGHEGFGLGMLVEHTSESCAKQLFSVLYFRPILLLKLLGFSSRLQTGFWYG